MSCFDRKLESHRPDFRQEDGIMQTDLVLTSLELLELLELNNLLDRNSLGVDLDSDDYNLDDMNRIMCSEIVRTSVGDENNSFSTPLPLISTAHSQVSTTTDEIAHITTTDPNPHSFNLNAIERLKSMGKTTIRHRNLGGESGGLCLSLFKFSAEHIFGVKTDLLVDAKLSQNDVYFDRIQQSSALDRYSIEDKFVKGNDYYEISLVEIETKKRVLSFARINGFRNIQNMLNYIKKNKINYNFIEVMACPNGGCMNGGGQILFSANIPVFEKNNQIKQIRNSHFLQLEPLGFSQSTLQIHSFLQNHYPSSLNCSFKQVLPDPNLLTVSKLVDW